MYTSITEYTSIQEYTIKTKAMEVKHDQRECQARLLPVRDAMEVLSGKWKIPIIVALTQGNFRFRELHRQVTGITTRMLSKELKEMELHGLVSRTVYDTVPVSVEYELTAHGKSLQQVVDSLFKWGVMHREKFIRKSKSK